MKNLFTIALTLIMGLSLDATARVLTVSNVAARPAQFTNLQAAVDSAGFGDTVLITGGGGEYSFLGCITFSLLKMEWKKIIIRHTLLSVF